MKTWKEKSISDLSTPQIDVIYKQLFKGCTIKRPDWTHESTLEMLDKDYGIDAHITLQYGNCITVQEKVLQHYQIAFQHCTIEYYNNEEKDIKGDWHHCIAGLYFFAYSNADHTGFLQWHLLSVPHLFMWLNTLDIKKIMSWKHKNNIKTSHSNFIGVPFIEIPEICYIYKSYNK